MCLGVTGDNVKSADSDSVGRVMSWDGIRDSAFLTSFQVMLTQLVHKPHLAHQGCRATVLKLRHVLMLLLLVWDTSRTTNLDTGSQT